MTQIYTKNVGLFLVLPAPLNPIGAFDAERFKSNFRTIMGYDAGFKFVAVDLSGLDFVYSDAYNAFIQFQQEMDDRHGLFAVLTNNQTIVDGLKKAGLDKNIKVFAFEADMMSFSLQARSPEANGGSAESAEESIAPVASQNIQGETAPVQHLDRRTGQHRSFTKSFNAIAKDDSGSKKKGLDVPFDDEPSSARTVIIVVLLLLAAVGGTLAFFYF